MPSDRSNNPYLDPIAENRKNADKEKKLVGILVNWEICIIFANK